MPATVTPVSGSLGNKETATLTAYTVTPAGGTTITQIVERVNGVVTNTFNNPASLSRSFVVPTATWDTLAYFSSHTVTITVTDSTSATTVITYTFNKRLATDASLLEATKANTDAKNRIAQKRDALAAQVGLSAGSTFDAISAQLASGTALVKRNTGTVTSSSTVLSSVYYVTIPFATIGFVPKSVQLFNAANQRAVSSVSIDSSVSNGVTQVILQSNTLNANLDGVTWYINSTGVRLPVSSLQNTSIGWIAYG